MPMRVLMPATSSAESFLDERRPSQLEMTEMPDGSAMTRVDLSQTLASNKTNSASKRPQTNRKMNGTRWAIRNQRTPPQNIANSVMKRLGPTFRAAGNTNSVPPLAAGSAVMRELGGR